MHKSLLRSFFLPLISLATLTAAAQRQPIDNATQSPQTRVCINVYDLDCLDVQPSFPGGDTAMLRFINRERRYPSRAYREGIEGRVLCSFVVNEDGSISHVSVIKGVEESLNREAMRIISKMPQWMAGSIGENPVPVYYILPIAFRL